MDEETITIEIDDDADAAPSAKVSAKSDSDQILNELNQLGQKVAAAVQTALDSEERHKFEDEIRKALRLAGDRIDHIADDVRKSDVTKDVQTQATRAAEAVQKSEVTKQVREGLLSGLRRFNQELGSFLDKSGSDPGAESAGQAAAEAGKAAASAGEAAADAASAVVQEAKG